MNWEDEIKGFLTRSIDLYMKYYIQGKLERVKVMVYIEDGYAEITIDAGGESENIDFDLFRSASEEDERDAQRECYFENESLWMDYLIGVGGDKASVEDCMAAVADGLKEHYGVDVVVQAEWE